MKLIAYARSPENAPALSQRRGLGKSSESIEDTYHSSSAEEQANTILKHVPWVPECQEVNNSGEAVRMGDYLVMVRFARNGGNTHRPASTTPRHILAPTS